MVSNPPVAAKHAIFTVTCDFGGASGGPPRINFFPIFLAQFRIFWKNVTPTNLEPPLQIRFVGAADQPSLQISDL